MNLPQSHEDDVVCCSVLQKTHHGAPPSSSRAVHRQSLAWQPHHKALPRHAVRILRLLARRTSCKQHANFTSSLGNFFTSFSFMKGWISDHELSEWDRSEACAKQRFLRLLLLLRPDLQVSGL
jgi:hypothetical protein